MSKDIKSVLESRMEAINYALMNIRRAASRRNYNLALSEIERLRGFVLEEKIWSDSGEL